MQKRSFRNYRSSFIKLTFNSFSEIQQVPLLKKIPLFKTIDKNKIFLQFPKQEQIDKVKDQRKTWRKKTKKEHPKFDIGIVKARIPTKFNIKYNLDQQLLSINFDTEVGNEIIDLTFE